MEDPMQTKWEMQQNEYSPRVIFRSLNSENKHSPLWCLHCYHVLIYVPSQTVALKFVPASALAVIWQICILAPVWETHWTVLDALSSYTISWHLFIHQMSLLSLESMLIGNYPVYHMVSNMFSASVCTHLYFNT